MAAIRRKKVNAKHRSRRFTEGRTAGQWGDQLNLRLRQKSSLMSTVKNRRVFALISQPTCYRTSGHRNRATNWESSSQERTLRDAAEPAV